jgi:trk system potassium uptake protein TrkA
MAEEKFKTFLVIGLGVFGSQVVRHLAKYNVDIIGIDKDEKKVEDVKDFLKIAIVGDATDSYQLDQAGVNAKDVDVAIVAIGESVESNVYVSLLLKERGIKKVFSRALNDQHANILAKIGADKVIFPEEDAAKHLVSSLSSPQVLEMFNIAEDYSVAEIPSPKMFFNKMLQELGVRTKYNVTIIGIKRKTPIVNETGDTDTKEEIILLPSSDEEILDGDILIVAGKNQDIEKFKKIIE